MKKFNSLYNRIMEEVATYLQSDNKMNSSSETTNECCEAGVDTRAMFWSCYT